MRDIVIERDLAYPREMVWAALTDSASLAAWLMPNDFVPEVGRDFTFRTDPAPGFDGVVRARVLELSPPERLAFTWRGGPLDTVVRFTLSETARGGTLLTLRHEGFRGLGNAVPRIVLGFGWRSLVARKLPAHLAGRGGVRAAA